LYVVSKNKVLNLLGLQVSELLEKKQRETVSNLRHKNTTMNHQDQMMLMSQLFPACEYTQIISQQG